MKTHDVIKIETFLSTQLLYTVLSSSIYRSCTPYKIKTL